VQKSLDLLPGDSANLNAFCAASIAAEDSNSRPGRFQKLREELDQRVIGTILDRRGLQPYLQCAAHFAGEFVPTGPGLDADGKDRRTVALLNF
jgi:hypothetical protein